MFAYSYSGGSEERAAQEAFDIAWNFVSRVEKIADATVAQAKSCISWSAASVISFDWPTWPYWRSRGRIPATAQLHWSPASFSNECASPHATRRKIRPLRET
jgi:hypothetical protein